MKGKKQTKNGELRIMTTISIMKNVTPINPSWLADIAQNTPLLSLGNIPLKLPSP